MIKLLNILNEITVNQPKEPEYRKRIREYIRRCSKGNLDLSNLNEKVKLPDNFTVGGNLSLSNTQITSLPNNLKVGGALYLNHTPITSLPDNLTVGGTLYLGNTPLSQNHTEEEIRKMIKDKGGFVKGNIKF